MFSTESIPTNTHLSISPTSHPKARRKNRKAPASTHHHKGRLSRAGGGTLKSETEGAEGELKKDGDGYVK
ncbi:MAG: hypothetical protein K0A89_04000 [ANME-2 cluster archaeon]|nr:hypothetical protein [ANME-2 cluster archaeon]